MHVEMALHIHPDYMCGPIKEAQNSGDRKI